MSDSDRTGLRGGKPEGWKFPLETETSWFVLVSALDFFVTYILLRHPEIHFVESNPVAVYFLNHWGIKGLLAFKAAVVMFVVALCQIIARHNEGLARRVLFIGTAIVSVVVVYSVYLHQTHTGGLSLPISHETEAVGAMD